MNELEFIEKCNNSVSMRQASIDLGVKYSTFIRIAKKLNCYKPNQNWRKGKTIISEERMKSKYGQGLDIFCENSKARREYIKRLIILNELIEYKCGECGMGTIWNEKIISLQLDHINGVRNDNRIENLRFLCPNCHSQTESYCNKNRSNGITINQLSIEEIKECINNSKTLTDVINVLGLKDTKKNRTILKNLIHKNDILFKKT